MKVIEDDPRFMINSEGQNIDMGGALVDAGGQESAVQKSCHILPIDSSNFYHDHNKYNVNKNSRMMGSSGSSDYGSCDEPAISIQEDRDDEDASSEKERAKNGRRGSNERDRSKNAAGASQAYGDDDMEQNGEDDPQTQNVRLMEKHAQIQRGLMGHQYASSGDQSPPQQPLDMTESQYSKQAELMAQKISQARGNVRDHQTIAYNGVDDVLDEEQLMAQRREAQDELQKFEVYKKEVNLEHSQSPAESPGPRSQIVYDGENGDSSMTNSIEQILEDEDGKLYIKDAEGNIVPYALPPQFQNMRLEDDF